jgi:hypothetical protein
MNGLVVTRDQLKRVFKDQDAVIVFERLIRLVNDLGQAGSPLRVTGALTSSAAGTAVILLDDSIVGINRKVYLFGIMLKVDGATSWADGTATIVKIQDTNGTPVVGVTIAKAALVGNAVLTLASSGVTIGDAVSEGIGFTVGKGISIVGDANFASGSDIKVTLFGFME